MSWLTRRQVATDDDVFVSDAPSPGRTLGEKAANEAIRKFKAQPPFIERFGEPARHKRAVQAAFMNGKLEGLRAGYVSGMHWGLLMGAIAGALIVMVTVHLANVVWPIVSGWFAP